jgi:hypothetical protein
MFKINAILKPQVAVRAGPSLRAKTVGVRVKGDIVHAVAENRHWVKVKSATAAGAAAGGGGDDEDAVAEGWMLRYQKKFGPLLQLVEVEVGAFDGLVILDYLLFIFQLPS